MGIPMLPVPKDMPESKDGIRVLTPEEIKTVEPIFESHGAAMPDPAISTFIGAVEKGKVVAFLVLQVKLHAEPMHIEQGYSHLFTGLVKAAEKHILEKVGVQWVYLFSPAGRTAQMAQAMGMQLEPWVVLSKLVVPDPPSRHATFAIVGEEPEPIKSPGDEPKEPNDVVWTQ